MSGRRILILGSGGMAGHVMYQYFDSLGKYELSNLSYPEALRQDSAVMNVMEKHLLEGYIRDAAPDIIINCIGILVRRSVAFPDEAAYINAYLPHFLSRMMRESGGKVIHLSTDCVFSGKKGAYSDDDIRDATDTYGMSKALGEIINDTDLTIRTSIIGPELKIKGEGLLHWFLGQQGEINGYTNAYWSGVTTLELAKAAHTLIEAGISGLFQLTNGARISKYDLLVLMNRIWQKGILIRPRETKQADKSLLPSSREGFEYHVPSYEQMLISLKDYMDARKSLYRQYYG